MNEGLMNFLRRFRSWLHTNLRRSGTEREMDAELRFHMDAYTKDLVRSGVSPEEAMRRARIEFGGIENAKEQCRDARGLNLIDSLLQDTRYGLRMLAKNPDFTAVAIFTLALGIGANTTIFSLVDAVMLRSLPVRDPQRLVVLSWKAHNDPNYHGYSNYGDCGKSGNGSGCSFSLPFFEEMRKEAKVFSSLAAFSGPTQFDVGGNGPASIGRGELVSGDFFETFGVGTILGRPLGREDDTLTAPLVAVLSHGYWKSAFAGDRSVIGRTIRLNGVPCTIVGVAEKAFTNLAPGKTQDFFLPIRSVSQLNLGWIGDGTLPDRQAWWVVMVGRLKDGVTIAQAQAAATLIFTNEMLHGSKPLSKAEDDPTIILTAAPQGLSGQRRQFSNLLYVLMAAVGLVLLIACTNLAGLALARSAARQKEMAVRLALGGGRWRIARQLLTESLMLSLAGGGLGVFMAEWGVKAFQTLFSGRSDQGFPFIVSADWRVFAFTLSVSVLTGLLFGVAPALRSTCVDLTPALQENASTLPGGVGRSRKGLHFGGGLVAAQIALSVIVLVGAGLLVRTVQNLRAVDPGFDTRNILIFGIDPSLLAYKDERIQELYRELQERFSAVPGVVSASYASTPLLSGSLWATDLHIPGQPPKSSVETDTIAVGPEFFSTMHISVLDGRTFTSADIVSASLTKAAEKTAQDSAKQSGSSATSRTDPQTPVTGAPIPIIVNEAFAKKYFEKQNPLGQHLDDSEGDEPSPGPKSAGYQIIGVTKNTKYDSLRHEIGPAMYQPLTKGGAHFELRTAVEPNSLIPVVRDIVNRVDSNLPLFDVRTQSERIEQLMVQERIIARLSSFFGILALLLTCIGLYGLLAYEVTRRTREIGIRVALGAQQLNVIGLVVGQGIILVIVGAVFGLGAGFGMTRYLESLLFGVRPVDPLTFAAVVILLFIVALIACYLPARRASRVDPMVALRHQ
jgi:predicted permease